jgi:hypothetical protein
MELLFFPGLWDKPFLAAWAAPTYLQPLNMSLEVGQLAAAMTQIKLCPYDEEEPAIWFCLIKAQFAMVGIKSQKLRYANILVNLP